MITSGNLNICLRDEKENVSSSLLTLPLETSIENMTADIKTYDEISNRNLYDDSISSKKIFPNNGPIINPATKNPVNQEMFLTLSDPELSCEIMDSHGGQKNAWAIPVITLNPIISGTDSAIDKRKIEAELITTPMERRCPLLKWCSKNPTNNGMNMYGMKFANPISPISAYDASITFLANTGRIGPCIP